MKEAEKTELALVMEKLEALEDESLAAQLLSVFNERTSRLGQYIRNLDSNLSHEEWKRECDKASREVEEIVQKIMDL